MNGEIMCGRFILILEPGDFEDEIDLGGIPESYLPRYNIAPTQPVAVVRNPKEHKAEMFRWGLIPAWAKESTIGSRLINARAESLAEKPSFRNALKLRRNLILASGFFEWKPVSTLANPNGKSKIPVFIHMKDHKPFVFAGLWEEWRSPEGEIVRTTTIITTSSNALIEPFHDRMPVILDGYKRWQWLDASTSQTEALKLLQPYPVEAMTYYPVSTIVNNPAYDNPVCIEEVVE
jgi:putative SOS response-associated peptidase YedK